VDDARRELFEGVGEMLALRVLDRASVGATYVPMWVEDEGLAQRLRVVSTFLRTLMEAHLAERALPGVTT
jgi:predicted GNAT family acetyltransferase